MYSLTKLVAVLLCLYNHCCAQPAQEKFNCNGRPNDSCSVCFNRLASETVSSDKNQYELQRAFLPPDTSNPVFIKVTYKFVGNSSTAQEKVWYWSTSTFYVLFQPPAILQFSSLFFTDPAFLTDNLTLVLPLECYNADDQFMRLLTQRVSLQ